MSKFIYPTCVFAMTAMILSAETAPAIPSVQTTAMIGLADGQTAQLNLLNPGILAPGVLATGIGVICPAAVSFTDANGVVLKSATLSVPPGKSMAFDIRSDVDLGIVYGDRRELRAVITIPPLTPAAGSTAAASPACKLIPTLEIFDSANGRTLVTLGHVEAVPAIVASNP